MIFRLSFFLLIFILSSPLYASRQVLIIGGGPNPNGSQVSIKLNTQWIIDIIRKHYPEDAIHSLYTDGNGPGVDVYQWDPAGRDVEGFLPLARVFDKYKQNGLIYRSSNIPYNSNPADYDNVVETINNLVSGMKSGDELLIIYQGHGGYNGSDTSKNYLRLWNDTKLTVAELEKLLNKADSSATIRFVLPQCFSGAFSKLVYKNTLIDKGLAKGLRCGFLSQRENKGSEGCTDSVNTDNYRDYSYYFFGALDGKTIDGDTLPENPDRDADGVVSMREAHLYMLANSDSIDLSHSTSEDYLKNWQPWYLRWSPVPKNPDNAYSDVARHIAGRFDMITNGEIDISTVKGRINTLTNTIHDLREEREALMEDIEEYQNNIKDELSLRWPEIIYPYTHQFARLMANEIDHINTSIKNHEDYSLLAEKQDRSYELTMRELEQERELVQMKKVLKMRNMARIMEQFQKYAGQSEKNDYEQLVQCENSQL